MDSFKEIRELREKRRARNREGHSVAVHSTLYWPKKSPNVILFSKNIARTTFTPHLRALTLPLLQLVAQQDD